MYGECFEEIVSKGGKTFIDLRSGTSLSQCRSTSLRQRDEIIKQM